MRLCKGNSGVNNKTFTFSDFTSDNKSNNARNILPAYANVRIKNKTLEGAMSEFRRTHIDSDHEWAYVVDSQGFVTKYVEGNKNSVYVRSNDRNSMILHNHPKGGAFSRRDMINIANSGAKGVVASGKKYDYIFQKGTHFRTEDFILAIIDARLKGKNYDDAVHKWLTDNQRTYGYKYYRKKN